MPGRVTWMLALPMRAPFALRLPGMMSVAQLRLLE
jgi:hypothetical protein